MGVNPVTSFFGNLFGIPDTVENARRDAANRKAPALPTAPTGAEATSAEKARIRKKTQTILTSPLKGDEFANTSPTLLGSGDITKKKTLG